MTSIRSFYQTKLSACQKQISHLSRLSRFYAYGKLVTFILAAGCGYCAFHFSSMSLALTGIILAGIYIFLLVTDYRYQENLDRLSQCEAVCMKEIAALNNDFSQFQDGSDYTDYRHPYTTDLDIFGPDSLFRPSGTGLSIGNFPEIPACLRFAAGNKANHCYITGIRSRLANAVQPQSRES